MKTGIIHLCAIFALASVLAASPPRRFGGGALTRSVQNETLAAIDRASDWLAFQQEESGAFGTNDVRLTAICALAISGGTTNLPPRLLASVKKAVKWLEESSPAEIQDAPAAAWRDIALTVLSTNRITVSPVVSKSLVPTNTTFEYAVSTIWPLCEARLMHGLQVATPAVILSNNIAKIVSETESSQPNMKKLAAYLETAAREFLAGGYDTRLADPATAWWFARSVNRVAEGELYLIANGNVLGINWRRDLAGRWISSQKSDEFGNGFWDKSVERTAFAILLLNEL